MKDDYKEFYESDEANLDSKSDAKVILFLIIVAVVAMTYWVAFSNLSRLHSHTRI